MLNEKKVAQLRWRCRRGMLELDLLLERFCDKGLTQLNGEESEVFETLLELPDPDLLACLMGYANPLQPELSHVVARIQSYLSIN